MLLASQALNTLSFPVLGALVRLLIVSTGLYWIGAETSIDAGLYLVALAAVVYGIVVALGLRLGAVEGLRLTNGGPVILSPVQGANLQMCQMIFGG